MASQVAAGGTDQLQVDNERSLVDSERSDLLLSADGQAVTESLAVQQDLNAQGTGEDEEARKQGEDATSKEFDLENRKYLVFAITKSTEQGKKFKYDKVGKYDVRQLRDEFKKHGNSIKRTKEGQDGVYTIDINKYSMHIRYKLVGHHLDTIMGRVNGLQENWDMQAIPKEAAVASVGAVETKKDALGFIKNIPMPNVAYRIEGRFSTGSCNLVIKPGNENGHIECVRILAAQPGIELNKGNRDDQATPLYWASRCGQVEIVELLCSLPDIDCNKANTYGDTPHSWACHNYSGSDKEERTRKIRAILEGKGARTVPAPAPAQTTIPASVSVSVSVSVPDIAAADPLAKYRRSYTEAQIAANRAKYAPEGTGEAIYAAAEKGDAAELLKLVEPWFAHPVLNDYSGGWSGPSRPSWTPLMIASKKDPKDRNGAGKKLAKVAYEEVKNFLESFASELGGAPEDYEKEMDLKDLLALAVDLDDVMQIFVDFTPTGRITLNDIYPSTTIKDLKEILKDKIQDNEDVAPDQQLILIFHGEVLDNDDSSLSDHSIKKESVLTLKILDQVDVPVREEENNKGQPQPTHAVSVCCGCSGAAGFCCCAPTRPEERTAMQYFLHPYIDVKKNAVLISFGDLRCVLTSEKLYLLFQENSTDHLAKLKSIIKNASYCFSKSLQRIGTTPRTGSSQQSVLHDESLTLFDEAMLCAIFLETNNMRQYVRMEALQFRLTTIAEKYKKMSYRISSDDLEAGLLPLRKDLEDILLELRAQKQCLDEAMHRQNHLLFMNVTFLAEHQDIYLSGASRDILRKFDNGKMESQLYNALLRTRTCERKAVTAQSKVAEMMEHVESVKNDDQTTVLVVNTAVTILATCIGFAGYITGAFGMNLDQTEWLQTTPGTFQSVCIATLVFIAAGAPIFVVLLQKFNFLPSAFSTKDIDPEKRRPRLDVTVAFAAELICKPLRKRAGVAAVTTSSKETKRASVKSEPPVRRGTWSGVSSRSHASFSLDTVY